jgi:ATP synthase protein I
MGVEKKGFAAHIEKSAVKRLEAKKQKDSFWHWASMIGMGGWLFALPVVAGAYFGRYLDRSRADGTSWTMTFILLGIAAGIFNIWQFLIRREDQ